MRKGILLAGGHGTRLSPITQSVSKQLLPIYDKPMIYYSLSTLLLAEIREILVITRPQDSSMFRQLLGDGSRFGVNFTYAEQTQPRGIADAFLIGQDFLCGSPVTLVLGDNLFYGQGFSHTLKKVSQQASRATIFAHQVTDPQRYGIVTLDVSGAAISIDEKPETTTSNYAIPGLYFYDSHVCDIVSKLKPSARGELEITDVNREYLKRGDLNVEFFSRGFSWFDTGTADALLEASQFVSAIEKRQGLKIGCPEEIAFRMGLIGRVELADAAALYPNQYGDYLMAISMSAKQ